MKIVPFALLLWYYHTSHLLCTLDLYITKPFSPSPSLQVFPKKNAPSQLIVSSNFQLRVCRIKCISHPSAPWFYYIPYNFFSVYPIFHLAYLQYFSILPTPQKFPMHKKRGGFPLLCVSQFYICFFQCYSPLQNYVLIFYLRTRILTFYLGITGVTQKFKFPLGDYNEMVQMSNSYLVLASYHIKHEYIYHVMTLLNLVPDR